MTTKESRKGKLHVGFQEIKCYLIFDVEMDGKLTRKSRFVAGLNTTDPPVSLTYSSASYRDSLLIAFTISDQNDIYIWECNTGNT